MILLLLHVLTGFHVIKLHNMKQEKMINNHIGSITKKYVMNIKMLILIMIMIIIIIVHSLII